MDSLFELVAWPLLFLERPDNELSTEPIDVLLRSNAKCGEWMYEVLTSDTQPIELADFLGALVRLDESFFVPAVPNLKRLCKDGCEAIVDATSGNSRPSESPSVIARAAAALFVYLGSKVPKIGYAADDTPVAIAGDRRLVAQVVSFIAKNATKDELALLLDELKSQERESSREFGLKPTLELALESR